MRNIACIILALILFCAPLVAIDLSSIDREGLDHYLDGLIPTLMERYSIAGSSIALVRDGSILTQRAYGYADIDSKEPVEASSTLFRIGSISKVFTWIAILQLHEKGLLHLAEDINTYLDFKIENPYTTPITLAHLATHTAGLRIVPMACLFLIHCGSLVWEHGCGIMSPRWYGSRGHSPHIRILVRPWQDISSRRSPVKVMRNMSHGIFWNLSGWETLPCRNRRPRA